MSGVMGGRVEGRVGEEERSWFGASDGRPEGGREVRWSARRKEEVVLRLLRGEGLDALARETGQAAGTISAWREDFLAAGREGLKSRPAQVEDRRLTEAQRKIGELALEADILRGLIEEMGRHPRSPSAERR
jgi:transposase